MTNYGHCLAAAHFCFFADEYENLHRFSQQGWEAMNQKIKYYYFNNTSHGGSRGNKSGNMVKGEHVKDIVRMIQRWHMWRLGLGDAFFNPLEPEPVEEDEDAVIRVENGIPVAPL